MPTAARQLSADHCGQQICPRAFRPRLRPPPPQSCIYIQDLLLVAEICSQRRLLKAKRRLDLLQRFCLVLLSLDLLFFF